MGKENRIKTAPDINEAMMMDLMVDGVKKEGIQFGDQPIEETQKQDIKQEKLLPGKPLQREKKQTQKNSDANYGDRFLKNHSMTKRGDKGIYIRQEYHERLSRIVQVIGKDQIPLYAYLDNILKHHFEVFEQAITEDFNEKFKPIF